MVASRVRKSRFWLIFAVITCTYIFYFDIFISLLFLQILRVNMEEHLGRGPDGKFKLKAAVLSELMGAAGYRSLRITCRAMSAFFSPASFWMSRA